jgi:ceramide glucosyltransferase
MAMSYAAAGFAFFDISRSAAGTVGANAAELVAGGALPCLAAAYAAWMMDLNVARQTHGAALAWYGPEALLARLNKWHFSWRMPLLFVFRDLILPVIYIDAWIIDEFVWRGNAMTMREEEPSAERG